MFEGEIENKYTAVISCQPSRYIFYNPLLQSSNNPHYHSHPMQKMSILAIDGIDKIKKKAQNSPASRDRYFNYNFKSKLKFLTRRPRLSF